MKNFFNTLIAASFLMAAFSLNAEVCKCPDGLTFGSKEDAEVHCPGESVCGASYAEFSLYNRQQEVEPQPEE